MLIVLMTINVRLSINVKKKFDSYVTLVSTPLSPIECTEPPPSKVYYIVSVQSLREA